MYYRVFVDAPLSVSNWTGGPLRAGSPRRRSTRAARRWGSTSRGRETGSTGNVIDAVTDRHRRRRQSLSRAFRRIQNGVVECYALVLVLGLARDARPFIVVDGVVHSDMIPILSLLLVFIPLGGLASRLPPDQEQPEGRRGGDPASSRWSSSRSQSTRSGRCTPTCRCAGPVRPHGELSVGQHAQLRRRLPPGGRRAQLAAHPGRRDPHRSSSIARLEDADQPRELPSYFALLLLFEGVDDGGLHFAQPRRLLRLLGAGH